MTTHQVVSHDAWVAARKAFLEQEKQFTQARDALSAERRALPWEKVEKPYHFTGPNGEATLSDLFAGKSQLVVYHFMLGPDWAEGCKSCSFWADNFDGIAVHLKHRDCQFPRRFARAAVQAARLPEAHGLVVSLGVIVRQRFQLRLPGVVHQGTARCRQGLSQLRSPSEHDDGARRLQRLLQGRGGKHFPHLFDVCARASTCSTAPITSSIWCPRAATRRG